MHALYGFIGGRIFRSMYDKIKCIFLFLANYRMLIHGHFFVGFFLNSVLSVYFFDIYMIYIYIFNTKLDERRLETYFWKQNQKIFPYILWIKFWCFWFKHSTMSLSYCLCWLRQYPSLQSKGLSSICSGLKLRVEFSFISIRLMILIAFTSL